MLLFAQNYVAPLEWIISWSLCIEEHFYIALPLAMLAVGRQSGRMAGTFLAAAILLSPVLRWVIHASTRIESFDVFLADFYSPTHLRLEGLLLGVAAAAIAQHRSSLWAWMQLRAWTLAALGIVLVVGATWNPWLTGWTVDDRERMTFFPAVLGFFLVSVGTTLLLPVASRRVNSLGIAWAPFVWVAEHAYTLYLTHGIAASVARRIAERSTVSLGFLWAVSFAASFVAAAALRKVVELPGLRLRDRFIRDETRLPQESAAPAA
jgi:peptidoglycan/LPS O-acetylase OafA/YrhL